VPADDRDAWRGREVLQVLVDRGAEVTGGLGAVLVLAPGGGGPVPSTTHAGLVGALARTEDGPAVDCLAHGSAVPVDDVEGAAGRWPDFGRAARAIGVRSAHATPLRRHRVVAGTLLVVADRPFGFDERERTWCQALADVAAVVALPRSDQGRTTLDATGRAFEGRAAVERAVGLLAEQGGVVPAAARRSLRRCAAAHQHDLVQLAMGVIDGDFDFADVTAAARA
jgi:GAF domain/ANTAR domain